MARLSNFLVKLFAGSTANVGQFGSAATGTKLLTTNLNTIQALAAWVDGLDAATLSGRHILPQEELNGVLRVFSSAIAYQQQEGIAEYSPDITYYTHSLVKQSGTNAIYSSVADNNVGNALTDGTKWALLGDLGNLSPKYFSLSTNTTLTSVQVGAVVRVNAPATTITLPTAAGNFAGRIMLVNTTGITVAAAAGDTIDTTSQTGLASVAVANASNGGSVTFVSDGNNKWTAYGPGLATYASQAYVDALMGIGSIKIGPFAPASNWLELQGNELSRTTYSALYNWAVTNNLVTASQTAWDNGQFGIFGPGDGATTFNIPNWQGSFVRMLTTNTTLNPYAATDVLGTHTGVRTLTHTHGNGSNSIHTTDAFPYGILASPTTTNSFSTSANSTSQQGVTSPPVIGIALDPRVNANETAPMSVISRAWLRVA